MINVVNDLSGELMMTSNNNNNSASSIFRLLRAQDRDLELGAIPVEEGERERRVNENRRVSASNQCIIGLFVLFFFLRYPLITLLLLLALLVFISSCLRLIMQYSRHFIGDEILNEFWTGGANVFRFPQNVNITNLRLALLDRDFNQDDYEMLLALDDQAGPSDETGRQPSLSELPLLPPIRYEDNNKGEVKEASCSICLENFEKGQLLRRLPCQHVYHEECIANWCKQKGKKTTCPVCKAALF
eukprot:g4266.t1